MRRSMELVGISPRQENDCRFSQSFCSCRGLLADPFEVAGVEAPVNLDGVPDDFFPDR